MNQKKLFKGRDKRKKEWFWVDNEYLNGYGRVFGTTGVAIYVSLCRHANNETQECFPAQEDIAEELNISPRTVRRYIKLFEKYHIISVNRERDPITKKWFNNVYTLLDKEEWLKPEDTRDLWVARGHLEQKARGHQRPNNKTNIYNKTNNRADKSASKEIISYFYEQTNKIIGIKPEISPKDAGLVKQRLKKYSPEQLKSLIDWYLNSNIVDKLGSTLSICLSASIINKWKLDAGIKD